MSSLRLNSSLEELVNLSMARYQDQYTLRNGTALMPNNHLLASELKAKGLHIQSISLMQHWMG